MTNSRIALAAAAALSVLIASAPADARRAGHKSAGQPTPPSADLGAIAPYPTAEMPGRSSRASRGALNRRQTDVDSGIARWEHQEGSYEETTFLPHPPGCPRRAFCACGAAVKIFGEAKRNLWPVRAWRQFARDVAAPGNVAIERGRSHLFVLVSHVSGNDWLVDDFNSGGHRSRRHVRSVGNTIIVNPRSSRHADHSGSRL